MLVRFLCLFYWILVPRLTRLAMWYCLKYFKINLVFKIVHSIGSRHTYLTAPNLLCRVHKVGSVEFNLLRPTRLSHRSAEFRRVYWGHCRDHWGLCGQPSPLIHNYKTTCVWRLSKPIVGNLKSVFLRSRLVLVQTTATDCRQEVICFGSRTNIKKLSQMDTKLHLGSTVVEPVTSMRNLGVYMNGELNMRVHIGKISSACFYHLSRICSLRNIMSSATM